MNVFKHLMQRSAAALLALAAALFLLIHSPQARAKVFYGITTGGSIFSVDSNGSTATDVFNFALPAAAGYTLATRPSDGMLFYFDTNLANPNLWRWDPAFPATPPVLVGGATGLDGATRLGFDAAGNLYSMNSGVGTELWKLDSTTSKGVFIRLRFKFDGDLFGGKSAKSSSVNEKTAGASTVAAETGKN